MEGGSASSSAGTSKTVEEAVSPIDLALKRLDVLSVVSVRSSITPRYTGWSLLGRAALFTETSRWHWIGCPCC